MALRIRVEVVNLLVAVALAKDADLSVVVPRAADLARVAKAVEVVRADRVVKVVRVKTAAKAAKFTMGNLLL